jgi:predicted ATPase
MERIKIENFAGIAFIDIEIKPINILIGPQGTGKSVTAKLLYFFKDFFRDVIDNIESVGSQKDLEKQHKTTFISFFPKDTWGKGDFTITYALNNAIIKVAKSGNEFKLVYSENLKKSIAKARKMYFKEWEKEMDNHKKDSFTSLLAIRDFIEKYFQKNLSIVSMYEQVFIPAGRSFFAHIQNNIFSLVRDNYSLDPFLIKFGSFYEFYKGYHQRHKLEYNEANIFDKVALEILSGHYSIEKDGDFLVHNDNRKINISKASSGQQETLPLIIFLKVLSTKGFIEDGATIYIEEPEAHLYPNAQKAIVQLLARTYNNKHSNFQIVVTTHSPYILSAFNNLVQAGRLTELKPEESQRISEIIPSEEQLKPNVLAAYSLNDGKAESIIDEETGLISQTILDNVSNDIAIEFGKLLDIEF